MSETKAGNIEAIRDWSKRYFYTKSDVAEFFTKLNDGLTAYKLTIVGPANTEISITDNDQSDPQEYVIETSSSGVYIGLFFFNEGNTLSLSGTGVSATHVLSDYVDTIELIQISELIPQMTSNTTPNTVGEVIYSSEYSAGYMGYAAFDKNDSSRWNGSNTHNEEYIGYRFNDRTVVTRILLRMFYSNASVFLKHGYLQASNDGTNWSNLKEINIPNVNSEYTIDISNVNSYYYYRIYCDESYWKDNGTYYSYSIIKAQFYGYQP